MRNKHIYLICLIAVLAGCTFRQAGYTVAGAAAGGGIGYAVGHNAKDAVIGGLGGALIGNLAGQWQDKSEKTKQDKSYQDGYTQAKLDMAIKNWDENTGRDAGSQNQQEYSIMLPKRQEDGIVYDQQEITLGEKQ